MKPSPPFPQMVTGLFFPVIFLAMALAIGALARSAMQRETLRLAAAVRLEGVVTGTVYACDRKPRSGKPPLCGPRARVRYHDVDGQQREFVAMTGRVPTSLGAGDTVTVTHAPGAPASAEVQSTFGNWFMPGMLGMLALVFGFAALWKLVRKLRQIVQRRWLVRHGSWVSAQVLRVERSWTVRGEYYRYMVIAQWFDPHAGRNREFRSDTLYYEPARLIVSNQVDV